MPNSLVNETSPYLLQHAQNPVDWYPWGPEAFARAVSEDKPILLSVGYAACHWCHVMAHESFEDPDTAALMNALFINIKVDREERPDVDSIYMHAVQAMTGQGGWPMTVVLTPIGEPFWGGTYLPLEERPGMPSFKRVLNTVAAAWRDRRSTVERTTQAMRDLYTDQGTIGGPSAAVNPSLLERAFDVLAKQHDAKRGGFGRAPKFPQAMSLDFCLRSWARTGATAARDIAHQSFIAMARGGIYDQVGGGFHRYSVDAEWLVPHFEKMLYDNALLARLGTHVWQVTGDAEVARVVDETLGWVTREMLAPGGGFFASLDADSEGHEGTFYLWDAAELDRLLGDEAALTKAYWNVSERGNFEGRCILHVPRDPEAIAHEHGLTVESLRASIARATRILYDARALRIWPGRDGKILAGWNGLMARAFADAARVFGRRDWLGVAERACEFLRDTLVGDGRVMRVHTAGQTRIRGFLEDQASVALAFLALHEAGGNAAWLVEARAIAQQMREHFRDTRTGAWYDTADDGEPLITRPRDVFDNAVPSGPSLALELMLRLAELDGDSSLVAEVIEQISLQAEQMARWPNGFGHVLGVLDLALYGAVAVVLVGQPGSNELEALEREVAKRYLPSLVMAHGTPGIHPLVSLLNDRPMVDGRATAYVCRGFVCDLPTASAESLAVQLDGLSASQMRPIKRAGTE